MPSGKEITIYHRVHDVEGLRPPCRRRRKIAVDEVFVAQMQRDEISCLERAGYILLKRCSAVLRLQDRRLLCIRPLMLDLADHGCPAADQQDCDE